MTEDFGFSDAMLLGFAFDSPLFAGTGQHAKSSLYSFIDNLPPLCQAVVFLLCCKRVKELYFVITIILLLC